MYALNPEDGTEKWSFTTDGAVWASPSVGDDGIIYIESSDSKLYALNPDGTKKWFFYPSGSGNCSFIIDIDGTIYVGAGGSFMAIQSNSMGIVNSPWPKFRADNQNTGCYKYEPSTDNVFADFIGAPTTGARPLTVQFTDNSSGIISSWNWDFGDGETSNLQHPEHTYETSGGFSVSLMVAGPGGSNSKTRINYIVVSEFSDVEESSTEIPTEFKLHAGYPNPFNPVTTIKYELPKSSRIVIKVFDTLGRELAVLLDKHQDAGYHTIQWDASEYPSGMYIVSMRAGSYHKNMKMILLR